MSSFRLWRPILFLGLGIFLLLGATALKVRGGDPSDGQSPQDCVACHAEVMTPAKAFQHSFVRQGECRVCHTDYDQETHREQNKPGYENCLDCHPLNTLGRSHPVGNGVIDPNTNETMTCVSSCHLPHGSDFPHQTPYRNNMELCKSCHKDF
jgi:predicted CXXCH cytochrome family protein